MRRLLLRGALGALSIVGMAAIGIAVAAPPPNAAEIVKHRQELMKGQGADLGAIKGYTQGKVDQAKAEAAAAALTKSIGEIPDLFPPDTGLPSPDGKFKPKPEVWTDWTKFLGIQKTAAAKAEALETAVKSGDKSKIAAAFGDLGKNGCGACHQSFREKLKD
jgi:cytochrome c556